MSRFDNLENDSQRLGWFIGTLRTLVDSHDSLQQAETEVQRLMRQEWLDQAFMSARQTLDDMEALQARQRAALDEAVAKIVGVSK